jgi:universal stress protein A
MQIRRVLFATDFSPASEVAGQAALDLARERRARLHIVHVVPPVTDPSLGAQRLGELTASPPEGVASETALLWGSPAGEITAYARTKHVDLIVMGTHGRTGLSRAILGSVAERVVRTASCPVLTVPMPHPAVPSGSMSAPVPEPAARPHRCVVCMRQTPDLICELCRARIRGEALEQKMEAERPGRRGLPV